MFFLRALNNNRNMHFQHIVAASRRSRHNQMRNSGYYSRGGSAISSSLWHDHNRCCFMFHVQTGTIFFAIYRIAIQIGGLFMLLRPNYDVSTGIFNSPSDIRMNGSLNLFLNTPNGLRKDALDPYVDLEQTGFLTSFMTIHLPQIEKLTMLERDNSKEETFNNIAVSKSPGSSKSAQAADGGDYNMESRSTGTSNIQRINNRANGNPVLWQLFTLFVSLLLLHGIATSQPSHLLPFFVMLCIEVIYTSIMLFHRFMQTKNMYDRNHARLFLLFVYVCINCYMVGVVWNCYCYLKVCQLLPTAANVRSPHLPPGSGGPANRRRRSHTSRTPGHSEEPDLESGPPYYANDDPEDLAGEESTAQPPAQPISGWRRLLHMLTPRVVLVGHNRTGLGGFGARQTHQSAESLSDSEIGFAASTAASFHCQDDASTLRAGDDLPPYPVVLMPPTYDELSKSSLQSHMPPAYDVAVQEGPGLEDGVAGGTTTTAAATSGVVPRDVLAEVPTGDVRR